jgi:hypothetical protein
MPLISRSFIKRNPEPIPLVYHPHNPHP